MPEMITTASFLRPRETSLRVSRLMTFVVSCIISVGSLFHSIHLMIAQDDPASSSQSSPREMMIIHNIHSTNDVLRQRQQERQSTLGCLTHTAIHVNINDTKKLGSADTNATVLLLEQQHPETCGTLRRQWLYNPPISQYAQSFQLHQQNCSLPMASHYLDNTYGLGSHFILWGQALCNAIEDGYRMDEGLLDPTDVWIWADQEHCSSYHLQQQQQQEYQRSSSSSLSSSPMECYLPVTRNHCPYIVQRQSGHEEKEEEEQQDSNKNQLSSIVNVTDPRSAHQWCTLTAAADDETGTTQKALVRAAFTEYLFSEVSPLVVQEAQRQIGIIFNDVGSQVPDDLITVHIRWGDKFWEMDLPSIDEYIDGIARVLSIIPSNDPKKYNYMSQNTTAIPPNANIFLATEDPKAYKAFIDAIPHGWNVFADITLQEINPFRPQKGNRASHATRNTKGKAGLVALGSLLVAMEAKYYVLTTKSNWSTMMNHLRTNIIDPRCNNCTAMIDLRPGVW